MNAPEEKIDRALLKKYDRPGPRYTSYPTVPEWKSEVGAADYREALKTAGGKDTPLSLYFHIPFCRSRCLYCGCTTVVSDRQERADEYVFHLKKELALVASHLGSTKEVIQLHWGGGTPTFMTENQMELLFRAITERFTILPDGELAIEVDPRVTTVDQLKLLRKFGFNRLSMGVQDLTPEVQEAIGRNQTREQTETLFTAARDLGFSGINVDLIFGLPRQTVDNFAKTIAEVVRMGADRVAVYSFAYLPEAKAHQRMIPAESLPATSAKYDLFATAVEKFLEAGYIQIGMDHFARPDDELAFSLEQGRLHRNFMGYTTRFAADSIGFGMSAISDLSGMFAQNIAKLDAYEKTLRNGQLATYRGYKLSEDDLVRQQAILSLMCNFTLRFDVIDRHLGITSREYFSLELKELKPFIDDGLLTLDDKAITVLPRGKIFVRNIAMVFDAYLRRKGEEGSQIFSRTV